MDRSSGREWPRVVGRIEVGTGAAGVEKAKAPVLVALGGIHGNEPAGLLAAERVLARIERERIPVRGTFVVLAGNRAALAAGTRFVDRDLNRGWSDAPPAAGGTSEDREQRELHAALDDAFAAAPAGERYFVDLHTTSAPGVPFVVADSEEKAQSFALAFPLPVFFGLIGKLSSALLPRLVARGVIGVSIEGGQNVEPSSVDHHEAVLWIALVACGVIAREALPDHAAQVALLTRAGQGLPHAIEVYHRHGIVPADEFHMAPGFANIQAVGRGTLLARDRCGEIRADEDCLLVMPLYQGMGDDGFFLGRELRVERLPRAAG
ncbi:MAG: succinylglutamate desuccinylase/aspartoacylase family protein [Candidatus Eisenbacteria bacterium]